MRIRNLDEVISELRGNLSEYLISQSINPKKAFRCPNNGAHQHGDNNPSAGIVKKNPELWNCFACGSKGDIFLAAHYLEGMETKGQGFIQSVMELSDRLGVTYEQDEDGEEITAALGYVASVIAKGVKAPIVQEYLEERQFTSIAAEFGIGYADPAKLFEILKKTYEVEFIERNQLSSYSQFSKRMSFPLQDESGEVIGFAGRTLADDKRKYINSANSIVYQKSKFLYNLNRITSKTVYVFEGYADVWRAWEHGIEAVACCGIAFSEDHLNMLLRTRVEEIIFVFDSDNAGQTALERTLKVVENCTKATISYVSLSAADKDPDDFMRNHGKEAFLNLPKTVIDEPVKKKKDQFLNRLEVFEDRFANSECGGYKSGFHLYDYRMENIQPGLHLVGGVSNIGKTAWMMHLALRMAQMNKDIFVLYVSIDDNLKMTIPRVVANLGNLPVNQVREPNKFIDMSSLTKEEKELQHKRRALGWKKLRQLTENFAIIDIDDAKSLEDIEREIKTFQDIYGKPVAFFLDNFHKVRTKSFSNFKERFTHVSEEIKRITSQNELVTFSTVELTKLGHDGRPELENIKETVDIIYDAETIHMLHQDLHSKQGNTELKFKDGRLPGKDLPVLEVAICKNKISGYKGRLYYKFFTDYMFFEECDQYEQDKYRKIEV